MPKHEQMYVVKRNGNHEEVRIDKITKRNALLAGDLDIDVTMVTLKAIDPKKFENGITTTQLDDHTASICESNTALHPDYGILAGRIALSNMHKNTSDSVYETFKRMYEYANKETDVKSPMISKECMDIIEKHRAELEKLVTYDINIRKYFGVKTLERSYLKLIDGKVVERPEHALLRVAIGLHGDNLPAISESYKYMVEGAFTHASPTMFNAGTDKAHYSSCYLTGIYLNGTKDECDVKEPGKQCIHEDCGWKHCDLKIADNTSRLSQQLCEESSITDSSDDSDLSTISSISTDAEQPQPTVEKTSDLTYLTDAQTGDSIDGIYDTLKKSAKISQGAGGLGFSVSNIRAKGTYITGTGGTSNGIVPMLRVFNNTARYVDQGGGKRPGAFAAYLEPWHADVFEFLRMRPKKTPEEYRATDLYYAMWMPDLFMQRVLDNGKWSLMCPRECPGLDESHSEAFNQLYEKYEAAGKAKRTVKAVDLWNAILECEFETGLPYMLAKDACNRKSNQQHMGTIKSSNLCCEIIQYSSRDEIAVCNLASIALSKCIINNTNSINSINSTFNHKKLYDLTYLVTGNLNKVIDREEYPTPETRYSNKRNRPIGIGVQGLADAFIMLGMAFDSPNAKVLNKEIFETMYFAALTSSCDLAKMHGPYETYEGSPSSKGLLQHDLWLLNIKMDGSNIPDNHPHQTDRWNWAELRRKIAKYGLRNSLLLAPMPTASTAQILGNNEGCEPFTSNLYIREVLSGDCVMVNPHLQRDMLKLGKWDENLKDKIILNNGSVQGLWEIPDDLQAIYKTVWEIKQKTIIDMAADRGVYIDQSQSMNLHVMDPTFSKMTTLYFHAWKRGLKTLQYYFRQQGAGKAQSFSISKEREEQLMCSIKNREACMSCSS